MIIAGARGGAICISASSVLLSSDGLRQSNNALLLSNSTFTNNAAKSTASSMSSFFRSAAGGALWMELTELNSPTVGQPVYIKNCIFRSNTVDTNTSGHHSSGDTAGGALYFRKCPGHHNVDIILNSSIFSGNVADHSGRGGAVCVEGHGINISIRTSSFASNIAVSSFGSYGAGGALALLGGSIAQISNISFSQNQALPFVERNIFHLKKSGPENSSSFKISGISGKGGAIYVYDSLVFVADSLFLENSCLSGNGDAAGCEGGSVYLGPPLIENNLCSTFTNT